MKRRKLVTLIGGIAIAWPLACYAQQPKQPLKHVGFLESQGPCPLEPDDPVVRRLGELGWIEGQTIVFDCVYRQSAALIKFRHLPTNRRGARMC